MTTRVALSSGFILALCLTNAAPLVSSAAGAPALPLQAIQTSAPSGTALPGQDPVLTELPTGLTGPQDGPVPELSTQNSDTVRNPDGSYTADVSQGAINYQNDSGAWVPISNDLVPSPGAAYAVENEANDYTLSIPENPAATPVRIDTDAAWVTLKLAGSDDVDPDVEGSEATFDDLAPSADEVSYRAIDNGVKEAITLDAAPVTAVNYTYVIKAAPGITPSLTDEQTVEFRNTEGDIAFIIPPGNMLDSTPAEQGYSSAVTYSLAQASTGWRLTMTPDLTWLQDETRVYPVVIDPTLIVDKNPQKDCWLQESAANSNRCNWNYIYAGVFSGTRRRGLLDFGIDFIPPGATVNNAEVWLSVDSALASGNEGAALFNLYTPGSRWSQEATWNNAGSGLGAWTGGSPTLAQSSAVNLGGNSHGWFGWNVTGTVRGWRQGEQQRGFLLRQQSESVNRGIGINGTNGPNAAGKPILRVTYTTHEPTADLATVSPWNASALKTLQHPRVSVTMNDSDSPSLQAAVFAFNPDGSARAGLWSGPVAPGGTGQVVFPSGYLLPGQVYYMSAVAYDGANFSSWTPAQWFVVGGCSDFPAETYGFKDLGLCVPGSSAANYSTIFTAALDCMKRTGQVASNLTVAQVFGTVNSDAMLIPPTLGDFAPALSEGCAKGVGQLVASRLATATDSASAQANMVALEGQIQAGAIAVTPQTAQPDMPDEAPAQGQPRPNIPIKDDGGYPTEDGYLDCDPSAESFMEYMNIYSDISVDDFKFFSNREEPCRFNWEDNGCNIIHDHVPGVYDFTYACKRHDWGYTNLKRAENRFGDAYHTNTWRVRNKNVADEDFLRDMKDDCDGRFLEPECKDVAHTAYVVVSLTYPPTLLYRGPRYYVL